MVGIDGLVLRTDDGGAHLGRCSTASRRRRASRSIGFRETLKNPGMYAVRVEGDYGVVVGDIGMVLTSSDGGATWTRRELPEKQRLVWMRDVSLAPGRGRLRRRRRRLRRPRRARRTWSSPTAAAARPAAS